jgi:multiple sugar transport system substrate-binding protein
MRNAVAAAVTVSVAAVVAAGCGSGAQGPPTLKYYAGLDPGGTNIKAAQECGAQSGGRYRIEIVPLTNSADASRELLVRRLAAKDSDIDLISMDTIWTPEFAEAGWLRKLTGADKRDALDNVLPGPAQSVQWKGSVYAVPLNTNAQLLWYRKDLVRTPPETWAEMIAIAKRLPAGQGIIQEQGQRYEGYVVWFNNLVSSAGGKIVNSDGTSALDQTAVKAAQIIKDVATSGRADPALSTNQEDETRLAFEAGKGAFMLNWPYVYASARADAATSPVTKKVFQNLGWARWPGVDHGKHPALATQAALCLTSRKYQDAEAIVEGLPPVMSASYDDPKVRKAYPFADLLREQLKDAVPRPETPAYADVTLAIQQTLHPPKSVDPANTINTLRDRLKTLADGGLY